MILSKSTKIYGLSESCEAAKENCWNFYEDSLITLKINLLLSSCFSVQSRFISFSTHSAFSREIMFTRKSNEKSEALRKEGNEFYSRRKFFKALLKYNESLCFAEPESDNVGHAYANRSAVYFETRLYEKCLNNVQLAKSHRYPESNFEVLAKREEKCRGQKEKSSDVWSFFKLSYKPNQKLPFIADCLEVKKSDKYGRHVITNRSLKVGDIVVVERPFCRWIKFSINQSA